MDGREDESHDKADTMKGGFRHSDPVSAECDSTTPKLFKLKISNWPKKKRKVKSWMREQAAREVVDSFECSDEEEEVHPREESSVSTVLLQPKQGMRYSVCVCAHTCVHTHACTCADIHRCVCVSAHVCVCVCVCAHMCLHALHVPLYVVLKQYLRTNSLYV